MHGTSVIGGIVRGTHLCESLPIGQWMPHWFWRTTTKKELKKKQTFRPAQTSPMRNTPSCRYCSLPFLSQTSTGTVRAGLLHNLTPAPMLIWLQQATLSLPLSLSACQVSSRLWMQSHPPCSVLSPASSILSDLSLLGS